MFRWKEDSVAGMEGAFLSNDQEPTADVAPCSTLLAPTAVPSLYAKGYEKCIIAFETCGNGK